MKKKILSLDVLKVKSFTTGSAEVKGGSLATVIQEICDYGTANPQLCSGPIICR